MIQSTLCVNAGELHVAIIMDGNGRWAASRGRPRRFGHVAGAAAVRRTVEAATASGIGALTLFAFSSDNWKRPSRETATLMALFRSYLAKEVGRCVENGVRLRVVGRRDRLPKSLLAAIQSAEAATMDGGRLDLRIAVDYSSRDQIVAAARRGRFELAATRESFADWLASARNDLAVMPDVDILVRTGGEHRLSDFLLWESAYAEIFFLEKFWPDFGADDLEAVIRDFLQRDRRFGGVGAGDGTRTAGRPPAKAPSPR